MGDDPHKLVIDVPVVETYDTIMTKYGEAQGKVLVSACNSTLRQFGLRLPQVPTLADYSKVAKELMLYKGKLMAAIVVFKPWRGEDGSENVSQIVYADVVPLSTTPEEYRRAIIRHDGRRYPLKEAQFNICDYSSSGLGVAPKA